MSPPNTRPEPTDIETPELGPDPAKALPAARPPVGTGASPLFAQLLALALMALGAVGIQEALVRTGVVSQESWTRTAAASLDGLAAETWMVPVFVVVALAGLLLLVVVVKPRPRKALTLSADTGVYLRTRDLSRIADGLLEGADGVTDVSTRARRRRLLVTATTLAGKDRNAVLEGDLRDRLAPVLRALKSPPKVALTIRNEDLR
ncbi:MAG: hypothetical protein ABI873_04240 [Marmoricola sp.]